MASKAITDTLVQIIIQEIEKDGGVTLINSLPASNPLISSHLTKEKLKLVSFLKTYPHIFQVDINNSAKKHIVRLLHDGNLREVEQEACQGQDAALKEQANINAKKELVKKTRYELHKRLSKLQRRCKQNCNEDCIDLDSNSDYVCISIPGAQIDWLAKRVQKELHRYTRTCPQSVRPRHVLPFSNEWFEVAKIIYLDFLQDISRFYPPGNGDDQALDVAKIIIEKSSSDIDQTLVHLVEMPTNQTRESEEYLQKVQRIAIRVNNILKVSAPPIGGMDFGKLLQDQQLRSLTGGMDVRNLIEEHSILFEDVRIFQDENRGCKGKGNADLDNIDKRSFSWYIERVKAVNADRLNDARGLSENKGSRMAADEIGTFSLTKPRLACAMAKMLLRACKYGSLGKLHESMTIAQGVLSNDLVCIDLTASVGGNTIAFAKAFSRVYAYEIDEQRTEHLKSNLDHFLDAADRSKVVVQCTDSMKAIQQLANDLRPKSDDLQNRSFALPRVAVFVDPPFGGIHYRSTNANETTSLNLGEDMPLARVIAIISCQLSPVTIGLKLPLHFDVANLVSQAKQEAAAAGESPQSLENSLDIRTLITKKVERQLFAIIDIK